MKISFFFILLMPGTPPGGRGRDTTNEQEQGCCQRVGAGTWLTGGDGDFVVLFGCTSRHLGSCWSAQHSPVLSLDLGWVWYGNVIHKSLRVDQEPGS